MKKLVSILMVACLMLGGVAFANPFATSKEKQESIVTSNPFNTAKEVEEIKTNNPFSTVKEQNAFIETQNTINSIGENVIGTVIIIGVIIGGITAAITSALVALIICAIKAKKVGGFSNAVKESFWKVFLITFIILIALLILF